MRETLAGEVVAVNVSDGGVPKRPVGEALVSAAGVAGDRQRNLKHHGGPDRAVCLLALEVIERLRGEGHPIAPGSTGENLTVHGVPWERVVPGACLRVGDALLEITAYAHPCRTIGGSFVGGRSGRLSVRTHPAESRVYARVRCAGVVRRGDDVILVAAAAPQCARP